MKALTDHKGEISCICSSKHLQIIVTGSLDMTTLLHTDKLLTESSLLASINLTSIVTVIRLVPWLDLLLTGSGEGFVSAWNIEDACYDGAPMAHEGEILTMQVIPLYPVLIVCDSYGEIVFWALHPLPYKYNRIFTIFNTFVYKSKRKQVNRKQNSFNHAKCFIFYDFYTFSSKSSL